MLSRRDFLSLHDLQDAQQLLRDDVADADDPVAPHHYWRAILEMPLERINRSLELWAQRYNKHDAADILSCFCDTIRDPNLAQRFLACRGDLVCSLLRDAPYRIYQQPYFGAVAANLATFCDDCASDSLFFRRLREIRARQVILGSDLLFDISQPHWRRAYIIAAAHIQPEWRDLAAARFSQMIHGELVIDRELANELPWYLVERLGSCLRYASFDDLIARRFIEERPQMGDDEAFCRYSRLHSGIAARIDLEIAAMDPLIVYGCKYVPINIVADTPRATRSTLYTPFAFMAQQRISALKRMIDNDCEFYATANDIHLLMREEPEHAERYYAWLKPKRGFLIS